jgi:hypothetical protein
MGTTVKSAVMLMIASGACGHTAPVEPAGVDAPPPAIVRHVPVNLLFVHGVDSDAAGRASADHSLEALEAYVMSGLTGKIAAYEETHPDVAIMLDSKRVNLYTGLDGTVLDPSIDSPSDGTGIPVATQWRSQLVAKLEQAYPHGERNVIFIGHSTGGRTAMEVTANVGGNGPPGSHDWGVADRIAGVITLDAMIHDLQSKDFSLILPVPFVTGCQLGGWDKGWCEYAGLVSGVAAADEVTVDKRSLVLIAAGNCFPSPWTGENDQLLPLLAQGCPKAPGTHMTTGPNGDVVAPGYFYGEFCHSDTTDDGSSRHAAAIAASGDAMIAWIADSFPDLPTSD